MTPVVPVRARQHVFSARLEPKEFCRVSVPTEQAERRRCPQSGLRQSTVCHIELECTVPTAYLLILLTTGIGCVIDKNWSRKKGVLWRTPSALLIHSTLLDPLSVTPAAPARELPGEVGL